MLKNGNGGCKGPGGKTFTGCITNDVESLIDCGAECKRLGPCIAFNYNEEGRRCKLITTSELENGCPNGYQWKDNDLLATSVEDFVFKNGNSVCYAKINFDENERR